MPDVRLHVNEREVLVPAGSVVAAAIAVAGIRFTRRSVGGEARGPLCGMGICYECRATIDGHQHRLTCQEVCVEGMQVTIE